ncbi:MAG: ABC transporter permease [Verrucomicrobiota bacterium]
MRFFSVLAILWRNLSQRRRLERDLTDEVHSYLQLAADAKVKSGMEEAAARREAAVDLGGAEQVKERVREVRAGHFLAERAQDLRYAWRSLRKAPVYSLTVVLVLALGIGSTVLMFALVDCVVLKGPPFPQANRIFTLWQRIPEEPRVSFSPNEFAAWKERTQVFENLAFVAGTGFTLTGGGEPELVVGRIAPPSLFPVLRTQPALGRAFTEPESNAHVVVLSDALWREKFSARADCLGEAVTLNGEPYTVIGVLPPSFNFEGPDAKLFVPGSLSSPFFAAHPDAHFLRVTGRLKPGVTRAQLDEEVNRLAPQVDDTKGGPTRRYFALSLAELTTGELHTPMLVLLSAVAFLLLIACANVANLTLARISARQNEISIRAALGASRPRLVAQLLTESALLAFIGGIAGAAIAFWGLDLLRKFLVQNLPELARAQIDGRALLFAVAVSTAAGMLFGLGPAFSSSRARWQSALQGATRSTSASNRTRQALVFSEIAIAAVLLIGCALMIRSFISLIHVDPGFRPANVVTAEMVMTKERYAEGPAMLRFYRDSLETVRKLPGAEKVGLVTHLPFGGNNWGNGFDVEDNMGKADADYSAQIRPVSPGYFGAMGIPVREERDFDENNRENSPGVAIVNETLAKRFWPNQSPIGKRIRYDKEWLSIIGVAGNIKEARLDADSDMEIYVPYPQVSAAVLQFVGRDLNYVVSSSSPGAIATELRNALHALDPHGVVKVNTMEALIRESIAQPRFRTWLIGIFAGFALTLACLGIYGVIAYLVTQRYKEIGIRLALGATRANIFQLILGRTFKLATLGVAAGLAGAFFLTRFLSSLLYGVTVHDPLSFLLVPLGLTLVALLAGYFPAHRAAAVDPVKSLRYE